jgi:hypothetical protein
MQLQKLTFFTLLHHRGKYEIQRVYNNHIQTATPTIAGAADTAKHTTKKYIGSIGQYRLIESTLTETKSRLS